MQDPAQLYRLETDVDLTSAPASTLVVALAGFMDAGHAQRLIVEHLLATLHHHVVATFDVDQLLDFRGRRPLMTYDRDHWQGYADPALVLYRVVDDAGTPFLLLSGPEPDYQWERVIEAVRQLSRLFGVSTTVTVHGVPMAVPHTRPIGASLHATAGERREHTWSPFGTIQVPGSLTGLLEFRIGEHGGDALGFAVHVPHYLAQSDFAPAAVAGLEALTKATGLQVPDTALRLAAAESMKAVDAELVKSEEAVQVVAALEGQYDAQQQSPDLLEVGEGKLPTADQLGAELEAFLRDQSDETEH